MATDGDADANVITQIFLPVTGFGALVGSARNVPAKYLASSESTVAAAVVVGAAVELAADVVVTVDAVVLVDAAVVDGAAVVAAELLELPHPAIVIAVNAQSANPVFNRNM